MVLPSDVLARERRSLSYVDNKAGPGGLSISECLLTYHRPGAVSRREERQRGRGVSSSIKSAPLSLCEARLFLDQEVVASLE